MDYILGIPSNVYYRSRYRQKAVLVPKVLTDETIERVGMKFGNGRIPRKPSLEDPVSFQAFDKFMEENLEEVFSNF